MKRLLFSLAIASAFGGPTLFASSPLGGELILPEEPLATAGCELGGCGLDGPGIWARTNPDFAGFPTFSFAADVVVLWWLTWAS